MDSVQHWGAARVYLGDRSGKYPDGNQVIVQGTELRVAFDTPQVANRIGKSKHQVQAIERRALTKLRQVLEPALNL